ncbi:hypothetical protein [Aporhodopirellula aestuarii]|uniref:Uncharacterized protein n=1 Tax=Aporhodopirellula aestuarii TaxID=2950107 RepID=A0ABT0U755_9BACT|nr:hypothetical protein [Aporhodopirellula aestuarii]MCM2372721.1 hypothetical protein [Aporhodopirellula aestuarii]
MNRRQWIETSVRWSLSLVIAVVAWVLTRRRLRAGCSQTLTTCRDCMQISRCVLPAAMLERETLERAALQQATQNRAAKKGADRV